MTNWYETAKKLSEAHVNWFLEMIRPLLIEHMIHGFKHGANDTTDPEVYIDEEDENNDT